MTGHRRLQEQLTPPHKKKVFAFLDIAFIFRTPSTGSLSFRLAGSCSLRYCIDILHSTVFKYKPSLQRIKVNFESQALVRFVPQSTPVIALVNTLFTSQLEELLKIWVGRVDVYLRDGGGEKTLHLVSSAHRSNLE